MSGKKNKAVWLVAGMGVLFVLLTGILYVGAKTKGPVRLVYIPKVIDDKNDFWKFLLEGVQMAAEESGAEVTIMAGKNETDVQGQIVKIREAISMQPDAILLSPISYTTVTKAVREIKEAGIRLVLVDSTLDEEIQDAAVCTDNVHAGEKMGEIFQKIKPERPVIGLVLHVEGSSTAIEREAGFRNAIGEYADCIVDTVYTDSDYEKGYEVTSQMLLEHPDINVVVGGNEYSAVGAARAVRDLGLGSQIQMIGFDSSIEELQMLEEGLFQAVVVQKPFNMGYLGVETAIRLLHGEDTEAYVDSGSEIITKENMYEEENQKLLFPFR